MTSRKIPRRRRLPQARQQARRQSTAPEKSAREIESMSDTPDNPKPFRLAEGDALGFEGNGERVPVAWPADHDEEPQDVGGVEIEQVLDLLMVGTVDARRIGERAVMLSYLMPRCLNRPKTLRELGCRLGCSHVAARARLTKLRREFAKEMADFGPQP